MTFNSARPEVLVSLESEIEAAVIVEALANHGIRAGAVGGHTAGFRAEAPGVVRVVVDADDLAKARAILAELPSESTKIDWSAVDCGDDSPLSIDEDRPGESATEAGTDASERRPFQFSIANLIVLQSVVSVVLSFWRGLPGAVAAGILVVGGMSFLAVAGTVRIGSDLTRGRREVIYLIRTAGVGALVFLVMYVLLAVLS